MCCQSPVASVNEWVPNSTPLECVRCCVCWVCCVCVQWMRLVLHSNAFEYVANGILMMTMLAVPRHPDPSFALLYFQSNSRSKKAVSSPALRWMETLTAVESALAADECHNFFLNRVSRWWPMLPRSGPTLCRSNAYKYIMAKCTYGRSGEEKRSRRRSPSPRPRPSQSQLPSNYSPAKPCWDVLSTPAGWRQQSNSGNIMCHSLPFRRRSPKNC